MRGQARLGILGPLTVLGLIGCPATSRTPAGGGPASGTTTAEDAGTATDLPDAAARDDVAAVAAPDAGVARPAGGGMRVELIEGTEGEGDFGRFEAEWTPQTTYVDADHLGLLTAADDEAYVYRFDDAGVRAAGLDLSAGRVLVLHGRALRRITEARTEGSELVVATEHATLVDAVAEGTVAWEREVRFDPERMELPEGAKAVRGGKDGRGNHIAFTLDMGEYEVAIDITLAGAKCDFSIELSKELARGVGAKFTVAGNLESFRSRDRIEIRGGETESFDHDLDGLRGEATLSVAVAASGTDMLTYELPVPLMVVPFVVGPIPMALKIKAQFVVKAVVPAEASAHAQVKFAYDSTLGFRYAGHEVSGSGQLGSVEIGEQDETRTGAAGGAAVNFGVGFPRVELSILGDSIVPWAQVAFLVGGSFTFFPACQTADALFLGAAGYDLSILGIIGLGGDSIEFYRQTKELLRAGNCE